MTKCKLLKSKTLNITSTFLLFLPARTKHPTQEMNPLRNELNGKVPTRQQYKNCRTPVNKTYNKYASITFNFFGVLLVYSSKNFVMTDCNLVVIIL